ncbi:MAG: hypothetical protein IKJ48_07930 [Alistipes sp.]|nr:hypothetical protein [Alistipes sp.]
MRSKLERQLRELNTELDDVYAMSEEAVCFRYNVDCKEEIITLLNEEIEQVSAQLEALEDNEYKGWCDPAFRTMKDFDILRI